MARPQRGLCRRVAALARFRVCCGRRYVRQDGLANRPRFPGRIANPSDSHALLSLCRCRQVTEVWRPPQGPDDFGPVPPALDCWYLTGPTAAGKTSVGLELAQLLHAEIISLDSMAVYRGMDIGTAKPAAEQQRAVPHHLIDILDPNQEFSVSNYVEAAHQKIAEIRRAGREVLFVGGTPMYLKAMLRGMYQGPPADWQFRREVEEEARRVGMEALHERLALVDPLSAAKLHKHDVRRIIRAIEVYKMTGAPISHQQLQFDEGVPGERCRVFVLGWPRTSCTGGSMRGSSGCSQRA